MKFDINRNECWQLWSQDHNGNTAIDTHTGYAESTSVVVSDTTSAANAYNDLYRFPVRPHHYYAINGAMKGENINREAICKLGLGFEKSPRKLPLKNRDKRYLNSELLRFVAFGKKNHVPLFAGEWGLNRECFTPGKGGELWVADMLDLFKRYHINFTYHGYQEASFGIYCNAEERAQEVLTNTNLIDLFRKKIR